MATSERAAAAPAWPARPRRRRADASRIAAALLLHGLLLWALWTGLGRVDLQRPAREVWTTLVAAVARPAATPARVSPPLRDIPTTVSRPARTPRARTSPPAAPAPPLREGAKEPQAITALPVPAASTAVAAAPPASAPSVPMASILDTEATRAAIRAVARGPLLSERVAAATGIAPAAGANERLSNGVEAARHGDCMHGDYPLGGAGLLSLPFLAYAAATGQCAK
jgi:hypothetical protein